MRSQAEAKILEAAAKRRSAPRQRREWLVIMRRAASTRRGMIGLVTAGLVVLIAVIGPLVAPHSPTQSVTSAFAPPASSFPLGGDVIGRDVLSRVLAGGWEMILISVAATGVGVWVGVVLGVAAAYYGRVSDGIIMRIVDVFLAFPQLVLALLLVSILGPRTWLIIIAVAISHAPQVARVVRSVTLDVCERDFVKAVQLMGTPARRVMRGEILPNLLSVVMVEFGLRFTWSILTIASLSFLGFGIQPPSPSWGLMVNENRIGLVVNPWGVLAPIVLVALLTIGLNTFTDAIARASLGVDRAADEILTGTGFAVERGV